MLAVLPMYDWPEVLAETDALWAQMRDALRNEGINAPDALDRSVGYSESWERDDLVLGQACGLPFALGLSGDKKIIGAMDFDLSNCASGEYYSAIVVRKDDPIRLNELSFEKFAYNDLGSQSGHRCLAKMSLLGNLGGVESGSHRASIRAVAMGEARFAAIDANTWWIALKHEPAARELQVLHHTIPTPAPVLIAHARADVTAYRRALKDFIVVREREDYLCFV